MKPIIKAEKTGEKTIRFSYETPILPSAEATEQENRLTNTQTFDTFWHFGDGGTSTDKEPEHTFDEKGSYQIRLELVPLEQVQEPNDPNRSTLIQKIKSFFGMKEGPEPHMFSSRGTGDGDGQPSEPMQPPLPDGHRGFPGTGDGDGQPSEPMQPPLPDGNRGLGGSGDDQSSDPIQPPLPDEKRSILEPPKITAELKIVVN